MHKKFIRSLGLVMLTASLFLVSCFSLSTHSFETPAPQETPQSMLPTEEATPSERKLVFISPDQPPGVFWTNNGQDILYPEKVSYENLKTEYQWFLFNIKTHQRTKAEAPFTIKSGIWDSLQAIHPETEEYLWFWGGVSPTKRYLLYTRAPSNYTASPADGNRISVFEVWIANIDGTGAKKLIEIPHCSILTRVSWFDQERKALIECSREGPPELYILDIRNRTFRRLGDLTGFQGTVGFGSYTLSSDETRLAITDQAFALQIVPLDGSQTRSISQWGYMPNWSLDSQRLYYQRGQRPDICQGASLHVYDINTNVDAVILESPLSPGDDQYVNIACGAIFSISPLENAAVFWSDGLWLVQWPRKEVPSEH